MSVARSSQKEWVLKKETELRCEVAEHTSLQIKVTAGSAEAFGIELAPNKDYTFTDQNVAIFTWYGCTIISSGSDAAIYIADNTPMIAYVNTHVQLEAKRDVALANNECGPKVMVVGPMDHGKSSTCQILASYAVRLDRTPVFVDLDVGEGLLSVPGCLSAAALDKSCLSVEEGLTNCTPIVYFHGHPTPKDNPQLFQSLASTLAQRVKKRLDLDQDAKTSGLIINTSGWVEGPGFDALLHCIAAFEVDVVLVMSHDKLFSNLLSSLDAIGSKCTVVKLPRSGGVVARDAATKKRIRKTRIREYFYGRQQQLSNTTLFSPDRRENVPLSQYNFFRVGGVQLSQGMKVFGDSSHQDSLKLIRLTPTPDLAYSIVAVLHPLSENPSTDTSNPVGSNVTGGSGDVPQDLAQCNVAGFLSVVQCDPESDSMTLLCPCPGAIPSCHFLVGSIKWVE